MSVPTFGDAIRKRVQQGLAIDDRTMFAQRVKSHELTAAERESVGMLCQRVDQLPRSVWSDKKRVANIFTAPLPLPAADSAWRGWRTGRTPPSNEETAPPFDMRISPVTMHDLWRPVHGTDEFYAQRLCRIWRSHPLFQKYADALRRVVHIRALLKSIADDAVEDERWDGLANDLDGETVYVDDFFDKLLDDFCAEVTNYIEESQNESPKADQLRSELRAAIDHRKTVDAVARQLGHSDEAFVRYFLCETQPATLSSPLVLFSLFDTCNWCAFSLGRLDSPVLVAFALPFSHELKEDQNQGTGEIIEQDQAQEAAQSGTQTPAIRVLRTDFWGHEGSPSSISQSAKPAAPAEAAASSSSSP
jgi:hypothetical protein